MSSYVRCVEVLRQSCHCTHCSTGTEGGSLSRLHTDKKIKINKERRGDGSPFTPKMTRNVKAIATNLGVFVVRSVHADGTAELAREKLEEELRELQGQLSNEVDLRAKQAMDFAGRLKEVQTLPAAGLSLHKLPTSIPLDLHTFSWKSSTWN